MTEPSQYFKGRTVQEQMDEVIGYVDKRAEEVAAAKAGAVLQPAEEAKTAAQAAAEAAEAAKDETIAALPEIRQEISGLKAEDTALDGRLDTVELKVTTAEGNIVTIQGQIVALQNVQSDYLKKAGAAQTVTSQIMVPTATTGVRDTQIANGTRVQNDLDAYAPMIRNTGNQTKSGELTLTDRLFVKSAVNYKPVLCLSRPDETKPWRKLYTAQGGNMCSFTIMVQERNAIGIMTIRGYGNSNQTAVWNLAPDGITKANYLVTVTAGGVIEVWHKQNDAYDTLVACVLIEWNAANDNALSNYVQPADFTAEYTEPVESDYTQYITPA